MSDFAVRFSRSAAKELERIPTNIANRVFQKIANLGNNPRPIGCQKLEAEDNLWRIRIGDYRVVYFIDRSAKNVYVRRVRHRREAYR